MGVISDAGSAVVLVVTLLFAVYTGDAILVRVVTHALVVRVVRFICQILLAWLPSFLVIGLLEVVRLAEVTLWSEVWTYGINFFFLGQFRNVLLCLHRLELHISNFICLF